MIQADGTIPCIRFVKEVLRQQRPPPEKKEKELEREIK